MPAPERAFAYAIVRVVPDIERGEFVNVGVVLFARQSDFLAARLELDEQRLAGLAPHFDARDASAALGAFERVVNGDSAAGPIAALEKSERFGWLVAPSSTIVQCSEVHTGICADPAAALDELFHSLVVPGATAQD